jgi:hypothetical protein
MPWPSVSAYKTLPEKRTLKLNLKNWYDDGNQRSKALAFKE